MALESFDVQCPFCGESIEIDIEPLAESQSFIEDCTVCCRPIQYEVTVSRDGDIDVVASRSN